MAGLFAMVRRLTFGALAVLAVVFAGLGAQGADAPARAALFSFVLLAMLVVAVSCASTDSLARAARTHWLSALAALLFARAG